jgi:IS30 family transposase
MTKHLTYEQVAELWDRYERGETVSAIARRFGRRPSTIGQRIHASGGIRPTIPKRAARHLSLAEREEISRGLAQGLSFRAIAIRLGQSPSTVSREVEANGGRGSYRAVRADRRATGQPRRPKICKLAASPRLRARGGEARCQVVP